MKITSNYQDFYDMAQAMGQDRTHVFKRHNTTSIKSSDTSWEHVVEPGVKEALEKMPDAARVKSLAHMHPDAAWDHVFELYNDFDRTVGPSSVSGLPRILKAVAVINKKPYFSYSLVQGGSSEPTRAQTAKGGLQFIARGVSAQEAFEYIQEHHLGGLSSFVRHKVKGQTFEEFNEAAQKRQTWWTRHVSRFSDPYMTPKVQEEVAPLLEKAHIALASPQIVMVSVTGRYIDRDFFKGVGLSEERLYTTIPLTVLGFGKTLAADYMQIYQDLDYCISNVLTNRLDPPIALSDKDKIQQYGFDAKVSFRHPVKPSKIK